MKKKTTYSFDKEDIELLKKPLINPCNECSSRPCGWWCQDRIRYEEKEKLYKERNVLELAEQLAELESLESEIDELEIKIAHMKNDYEKRRLNYYDDFSGRKCKLWGRDWKHFFSQKNDEGKS